MSRTPILGPWIGGGIATLAAFLHDPSRAPWTALAALAIQQVENNLIIPWAMSRSADLHPLVTLFAVVLFGTLFGFLGVLCRSPLLCCSGPWCRCCGWSARWTRTATASRRW